MANMSYCRFENTASDLYDCKEALEVEEDSPYEAAARKELIQLCVEIARDYGDLV